MAEERAKLVKLCKGKQGVGVSVDGTYNNRPNSKTPFQAGTTSVFTTCEDETPDKKVIHAVLESKLCTTRHILESKGLPANCPDHSGCTATMKPTDSIGQEERPAFVSAMALKRDDVPLERIKNDGNDFIEHIDSFKKVFQQKEGTTISTIHGVKGAEFDTVIAFGLLEGYVPHFMDANGVESAKRLLYVIGSRARKNLHLISETGRKNRQNQLYYPTNVLSQVVHQYDEI